MKEAALVAHYQQEFKEYIFQFRQSKGNQIRVIEFYVHLEHHGQDHYFECDIGVDRNLLYLHLL